MSRRILKNRAVQRGFACLLAVLLLLGLLPAGALAAEEGAHVHNEDGWACQKGELICGYGDQAESAGQEPAEPVCGLETGALVCGLEEGEGHTHTDECCHQHTAECYPPAEEPHIHADSCYQWTCTPPQQNSGGSGENGGGGSDLDGGDTNDMDPPRKPVRTATDLTGWVDVSAKLTLGGQELQAGEEYKESDLLGKELRAAFAFELPVGRAEFDENGSLIAPGTPIQGDTVVFPLPEVFSMVKADETEAAAPIDFNVTFVGTSESVTIGRARWDTEKNAIVLTFTDAMKLEEQDKWTSLGSSDLTASLWYQQQEWTGEEHDRTVNFFGKEFKILWEDESAKTYKLKKTVIDGDGNELGTNVTYSTVTGGNQDSYNRQAAGAIDPDGTVRWKVTVQAEGEGNTLAGLTVTDVPGTFLTLTQVVLKGERDETFTDFEENAFSYTFPADSALTEATFVVTSKILKNYWFQQGDWSRGKNVKNTAGLLKEGESLAKAEATVKFFAKTMAKWGSMNDAKNTQTWTIEANAVGHTIKNAYVVDTMSGNMELIGENPISSGGAVFTENTTLEQKTAKAPNTYTVESPTRIVIYLGDIDSEVKITVKTKLTEEAQNQGSYELKNSAALFGTLESNTQYNFGTDYETIVRGRPGVLKSGSYAAAGDRIEWKVTAQANNTHWKGAFLCEFIVPGDSLSLTEEQWQAFAGETGLTDSQLELVRKYYTNSPKQVAQYQKLDEGGITFVQTMGGSGSAGEVKSGTITADGETVAQYVLAFLRETTDDGADFYRSSILTFYTKPVQDGTERSVWQNTATLYHGGKFIGQAKASTDIKGSRVTKSLVSYDEREHRAVWDVVVNAQGVQWDLYLPAQESAQVLEALPEGWVLESVTLDGGPVETKQTGDGVLWEIPAELRTGSGTLTYRVAAVIKDPADYLAAGNRTAVNRACLLLDGAEKGSGECSFTVYNREPGKSAKSQADKQITWTLNVNEGYLPYDTAYVEDVLPEGLTPIGSIDSENQFVVTVNAWLLEHDNKGNIKKGAPATVTSTYNSGTRALKIDLPQPGMGYVLEFKTRVEGAVATSYTNTATFVGDEIRKTSETATLARAEISGSGKADRLGSIRVLKTDEKDRAIDGAVFRITNGAYIREAVVKNGVALFDYVPQGTYTVEEVKAAPGFQLGSFRESVTLTATADFSTMEKELSCQNQRALNTIAFVKQDEDDKSALSGVGFALCQNEAASGDPVKTAHSDAYGYVTFEGLEPGDYFVFETMPLPGYAVDGSYVLKAAVAQDGTVSYERPDGSAYAPTDMLNGAAPYVYNRKATSLTVEGLKELSGRALQEGEFTFELREKNSGKVLATAQNGLNGRFTFKLRYTRDMAGAVAQPKTYVYTISEAAGTASGVTYDSTVYELKVRVWMDAGGVIRTESQLDNPEAAEAVVFRNTYIPPVGPPVPPEGPDGPDIDIPDPDVPKDDMPDIDIPDPDVPKDDVPDIDIPDPDVPKDEKPETGGGGGEDEIIILDPDVPLGELPNTGLEARTLPAVPVTVPLALAVSLLAACASLRARKKRGERQ